MEENIREKIDKIKTLRNIMESRKEYQRILLKQPKIYVPTDHRSVGWVLCGGTYPYRFKSSTWHRCS